MLVSPAMRELDRVLHQVALKDVAVCLIGESGSGKEVLARRIHERSGRRARPFVPINCAAIPETLFESELFGHEKGAFTGASERVRGKVEAATGGTLFLDEIGELPLGLQVKLLRFLDHRRFMRVGGSTKIQADVRVVSATLRPLEDDVRRGTFRADLFYRIQGITLAVPPLRERRADVVPLARQLVAQASARLATPPPRLTRAALAALCAHPWPGNVRELANVVERLCVLRGGRAARLADLPEPVRSSAPPAPTRAARTRDTLTVRLDRPLDDTIDAIIAAAVAREGGNRARAAERLRIGLRTVQRRLGRQGGAAATGARR